MEEEKPRKSHAATWVCSVLAIVLLYVLSSGPTAAYAFGYGKMGITLDNWNWFYTPLIKFCRMTGTFDWLARYCDWCDTFLP